MIDPSNRLPVTRQCELLELKASPVSSEDLELARGSMMKTEPYASGMAD